MNGDASPASDRAASELSDEQILMRLQGRPKTWGQILAFARAVIAADRALAAPPADRAALAAEAKRLADRMADAYGQRQISYKLRSLYPRMRNKHDVEEARVWLAAQQAFHAALDALSRSTEPPLLPCPSCRVQNCVHLLCYACGYAWRPDETPVARG